MRASDKSVGKGISLAVILRRLSHQDRCPNPTDRFPRRGRYHLRPSPLCPPHHLVKAVGLRLPNPRQWVFDRSGRLSMLRPTANVQRATHQREKLLGDAVGLV